MRLFIGLLAWSTLLIPMALRADELPQTSGDRSVYQISLLWDGATIGVSTLGTGLSEAFASSLIHPRCPCDAGEVNGLDRPAIGNQNRFLDSTSDLTAGIALILPVLADYRDLGWSRELAEDMTVYAEVLAVNGALVSLAKYAVQRPLPRTYAGDPSLVSEPGGYRSFYSGHTSNVFAALSAAAMTLHLRYDAGVWPWAVMLAVGASVGIERVAGGRHFPTDVLTGAMMGTLVGTFIPLLHRNARVSATYWSLRPAESGAWLAWNHRF